MRRSKDMRGAAMVEFALAAPLLALLAFATIDLARAFQVQEQVKAAAHEGASYAARYPGRQVAGGTCADPDTIQGHVRQEGPNQFSIRINNGAPGCVSSTSGAIGPGNPIKVTVYTSFSPVTPYARALFGNQPTISSSVCVNIVGARPNGGACA